MSPFAESLLVLAVIVAASAIGIGLRRVLPEHHLADATRTNLFAAISIVGTLTALVLGLAFSNASATRNAVQQNVVSLATGIREADSLLRHYGPEADGLRAELAAYARRELSDLFPKDLTQPPDLADRTTASSLDQLEEGVLALHPQTEAQRWRQSQLLTLLQQITSTRWYLAEQRFITVPSLGVAILALWLAILFGTYALFMSVHATSIAGILASGVAMTAAILMILEGRQPFSGLAHISGAALTEATASLDR